MPIVINDGEKLGRPIEGSWEEVADDMYQFAKGVVEAPFEIAKESKEIIEIVLDYGTKPTEEKVLEVIGSIAKLNKFDKEHDFKGKLKFLGSNGWKLVKGIWAEFAETVTTPKKQGRILAEILIGGVGIPRVLKSVKTAGKVLDEITDLGKRDFGVGGEKTCSKKKLFDESDPHAEQQRKQHADHEKKDIKKIIEKFKIEETFDDIKHLPPLRQEYIKEVRGLKKVVIKLYDEGKSTEEIARTVSPMRRDIGIKYKNKTPTDLKEMYYKANIKKYGDPLGPTIEHLRKKGRSWEEIIESACREEGRGLPGTI